MKEPHFWYAVNVLVFELSIKSRNAPMSPKVIDTLCDRNLGGPVVDFKKNARVSQRRLPYIDTFKFLYDIRTKSSRWKSRSNFEV